MCIIVGVITKTVKVNLTVQICRVRFYSRLKLCLFQTQAIWKLIYDTSSAADIGTLYQARSFLNAKSVPKDPMKDVNASEELLIKYSQALLLAAYDSLETKNTDEKLEFKKVSLYY